MSTGYEEHTNKTKISHLLYMDDFRLIGKTKEELQKRYKKLEPSVKISIWNSDLTSMQRLYPTKKNVYLQNLVLDINQEIQQHDQGITYKYLGIEESEGTHQK